MIIQILDDQQNISITEKALFAPSGVHVKLHYTEQFVFIKLSMSNNLEESFQTQGELSIAECLNSSNHVKKNSFQKKGALIWNSDVHLEQSAIEVLSITHALQC